MAWQVKSLSQRTFDYFFSAILYRPLTLSLSLVFQRLSDAEAIMEEIATLILTLTLTLTLILIGGSYGRISNHRCRPP